MGLLLAYFYERDQDASRYAYYGVMGMRHRGLRAVVAAAGPGGVAVSEADPWSPGFSLPSGYAVAAGFPPGVRAAAARGAAGEAVALVDGGCPPEPLARAAAGEGPRGAAEELVSSDVYAPCAAVVLTGDGGYVAGRGYESRRPLSIGGYGFEALYAATETAPITLMGGRWSHDIGAGEAIYGSDVVFEEVRAGGKRRTSLFEYVYLARMDSYVDGVSVYGFRREMGRRLARIHDAEADVVVGVPETALPYALGYAEAKGARFELGFVSTLGRVRTALQAVDASERARMLSLKLNPVPEVFEGARVVVVDDSVVTGLTLKVVVQRLRRLYGAREVHAAVSSPRIVRRCPYSVQVLDEGSLVARALEDRVIERVLDVDSLVWLPVSEAYSFLAERGIEPCTQCMG